MHVKPTLNKLTLGLALIAVFTFTSCEKELDTSDTGFSAMSMYDAKTNANKADVAQSVMVHLDNKIFKIAGGYTWEFDVKAASASSCFVGGNDGQRTAAAQQNKDNFFNGTTLDGTKQVSISPNCSFEAGAFWKKVSTEEGGPTTIDVPVDITLAAQSVVANKNGVKYSFSLDESKISDLSVELRDASGNVIISSTNPDLAYTILTEQEAGDCLNNFNYVASKRFSASANLIDGTMGDIMAKNTFGPTSTCVNAGIAKIGTLTYTLGAGQYTLTVNGKIKNNQMGGIEEMISVVSSIEI